MITKTENQIIAFLLKNQDKDLTIRNIAKELKKSYSLVYNSLKKLEHMQIIKKKTVSHASIITLNLAHEVMLYVELSCRSELLKKYSWIKLMLNDILSFEKGFFILIIFGSYAKGTQTSKSDLDLLAVVQSKNDIQKTENSIKNTYTPVKKSIIIVDVGDFLTMLKSKEFNVGTEAMKNHIILHGIDSYYQIIKRTL